jgi:hypothetical protein
MARSKYIYVASWQGDGTALDRTHLGNGYEFLARERPPE